MTYKPDGYTDLAAYLLVPDAEAVLAFAERVFDAERLRVMPREGGGVAVTMLAEPGPLYRFESVELPGLEAAGAASAGRRRPGP